MTDHAGPQIMVKLTSDHDPNVERGLHDAFSAAMLSGATMPAQIASLVAQVMGTGCIVTPEAEQEAWSRYRVAVRVQGMPITIASVEVTMPEPI